jgi:hypothetical protein
MVPKHLFGIAAGGVPHHYSAAGLNQDHGVFSARHAATRGPAFRSRFTSLTVHVSYLQLDPHAISL